MLSADSKVIATGVPNGFRGSWAYRIDTNPQMQFVGDRVTRLDDPRETQESIEQLKINYGGENTQAYKQQVLGEWGSPTSMTFDVDRITADLPFKEDETPKLPGWYQSFELYSRDWAGPGHLPLQIMIKEDMPKTATKIYIHADHGEGASPTTIYVSFYDSKEGVRCWRQYMRVLLHDMPAPEQQAVFEYLSDTLERLFKIKPVMGIDATGGGGKAIYSYLTNAGYNMVAVSLSTNVEVGTRPETDAEYDKRMKKNPLDNPERLPVLEQATMKQVATPELKRLFYSGELRLVNQIELWKQVESTTDSGNMINQDRKYSTDYAGPDGDKPGYNHDLQAFEIFAAMIHLDIIAPILEDFADVWIQDFETPWGRIA
jgi:hypothetical protein